MTHKWYDPSPVILDFETQSACDLKAHGGRIYAEHHSTRVLSLTMYVDGVYHVWIPAHIGSVKLDTQYLWLDSWGERPEIRCYYCRALPDEMCHPDKAHVAHNAFGFDRYIWSKLDRLEAGIYTPAWADTIPLARSVGLPGNLNAIAKATSGAEKDISGKLMRKLCIATEDANGVKYPTVLPGDLAAFTRYNVRDVALLVDSWQRFASVEVEADVLAVHDKINCRGIRVDPLLLTRINSVGNESINRAADEIAKLTGGKLTAENIRSGKKVQEWMRSYGVRIVTVNDGIEKETLERKVVEATLAAAAAAAADEPDETDEFNAGALTVNTVEGEPINFPKIVADVLKLRMVATRITGAKVGKAVHRMSSDGRIRDLFTYHQAHTGRWSSQGVQVHNLPRPKKGIDVAQLLQWHGMTPYAASWDDDARVMYDRIDAILPRDEDGRKLATVDDALSALIRPCFTADPGRALLIVDYAAVEARCVAWLAGDENALDVFRRGDDPYKLMAAKIFGCGVDAVDKPKRAVGKETILGAGYSMGPDKFGLRCALLNINLEAAGTNAKECVEAYRKAHPKIAGTYSGEKDGFIFRRGGLWHQYDAAAREAIIDGGPYSAGRCVFARDGDTLLVTLPSGRSLHYRNARIEPRIPGYALNAVDAQLKDTVIFDAVKGGNIIEGYMYGGKWAENISQACCRDLMACGMVACDAAGFDLVGTVHDEVLAEIDASELQTGLSRMASILATAPAWAAGFPVAVEAFASPRYLKEHLPGWPEVKL